MTASAPTTQPDAVRYHDLDALRSFAILVVILFHTGGLAGGFPVAGGRPVQLTLVWCVSTAHDFQMPVFFMMSGFFGALAVTRSGVGPFVRGRLRRIGVPLVVGWILMVPLLNGLAVWGAHLRGKPAGPITASTLFNQNLHHLWFLWYLLMYCAVVLAVRALAARRPAMEAAVRRVFGAVVGSRWRLLALVPVTAAILVPAPLWTVAVPPKVTPYPDPFVYFGMFFAFGWLLYGQRELLAPLRRAPVAHLLLALAASIAVIAVLDNRPTDGSSLRVTHIVVITITALTTWTAVIGLLGAFHRWFSSPDARVRYVSDAAYFLFLGHLPLVRVGYYTLTKLGVPFFVKIWLVPAATVAILLLVYDRFVRYTAVGNVLHGPRSRPVKAAHEKGEPLAGTAR
jgi:peptidoglycan/LPS O-acetylase OafA/YrhL